MAVADDLRRLDAVLCIRARCIPGVPKVRSYSTDTLRRSTSITITSSSCCVLSSLLQCLPVLACPQHENYHYPGAQNKKRADAGKERDWDYAASHDWGSISSGM